MDALPSLPAPKLPEKRMSRSDLSTTPYTSKTEPNIKVRNSVRQGKLKFRRYKQFSMRSLEKVQGEWGLVCLTEDLTKIFPYNALNFQRKDPSLK